MSQDLPGDKCQIYLMGASFLPIITSKECLFSVVGCFYFVSAAHLHPSMIATEQPPTTIYSTGPYQTTVCVGSFLEVKNSTPQRF